MKKNRQLKDKWVAQQFLDVFKTRPHWPAKEIVDCIRRAFKVIVTREFAYRVKYAAHKLLHGSMYEHYKKVKGYLAALESCSPGSHSELVIVMPKQPPPIFQRLFICFDGLAKGWIEGCRKVLAIDGCFLKTFLGGQLFCDVGRDSNDQMFPVAWAVTEGENSLSWEWFLKHLQTSLELGDGIGLAILSDEHQAILSGVSSVLPQAEHRHCARHVYANWSKSYRGDEFKLQFWKIAKCYNKADYDEALDELSMINVEAALAFKAHNPQHFCRAFLSTDIKTDAITSNIAETFNGYIINARTKHLLHMLEEIRSNLMHRMVQKRQLMDKCTSVLCPRIQTKLNQEKDKAAMCEVFPSTMTLFNVTCFTYQVVVNSDIMTCTCRKWDMLGIPCKHAIACIFFLNKEAEDFVHKCYTKESYMRAYAGSIPPLVGERYRPKVTYQLQPPPIKIGPGRPRKKRVKDPYENPKKPGVLTKSGVEMTCSLCNVKGHNKRKCPEKGKIVQFQLTSFCSVTTNVTRGAPTHRSRSSRGRTVSVNQGTLNYLIMGTQPSQQSTLTQHPQ
ncbi:uncharacterized protein LOC110695318 [Chenopodium quinoa]|uniref:uncharacterized protein LOC110695318 n=1 Tax=Chenopodium quinoa TaxID=63459 RepID=UPI000B77B8ED|nr:uncharacterized protein LOC110695318 [Chenopodium quinoa]